MGFMVFVNRIRAHNSHKKVFKLGPDKTRVDPSLKLAACGDLEAEGNQRALETKNRLPVYYIL